MSHERLSQFYIDGKWVSPERPNDFPVINPATEEPITTLSLGKAADVDRGVLAANCDDINNDVSIGQVWTANVTNLASGNLSNTRYGSSTNPNYSNPTAALMLYEQGAWLVSQLVRTHLIMSASSTLCGI
jgi:hypothetical protein